MVDIHDDQLDNPSQQSTVYVITEEKRQYAHYAPQDELESVNILDVFQDKQAANWFVRRRKGLYVGGGVSTSRSREAGFML